MDQRKFIFVTGGVISSLGKGITCAAIGTLLEQRNHNVAIMKLDPYLNVDPGTMNPYEHGEVYVTDDGAETDLDLGHYYRFTHSPLSKISNTTSGQIYHSVIKKERKGDFLGKTVQVIPHITNEIKLKIQALCSSHPDVSVFIIEVGGTAGDIESLPFLEAIRQFIQVNRDHCINIHLTYVPYLKAAGEMKTKPTQQSVQTLRGLGLSPDIILCRCERELEESIKDKISLFCNVSTDCVIELKDVDTNIYEIPLILHQQQLDERILNKLSLPSSTPDLSQWQDFIDKSTQDNPELKIGVVGKYLKHPDAYKSVFEALFHASVANGAKLKLISIESDQTLSDSELNDLLNQCDGILVPGGFGQRGWEGKIKTAKHCRQTKTPYFGICLGMQVLTVEFARNVLGLEDANSTEFEPSTKHPVISLLEEQESQVNLGGTMRLGSYPCTLKKESKAYQAYQTEKIDERHRHRYELNSKYSEQLESHGLLISGVHSSAFLGEVVEVVDHPWMVGVQYHPEFKSRPLEPHPLFNDFIKASMENKK